METNLALGCGKQWARFEGGALRSVLHSRRSYFSTLKTAAGAGYFMKIIMEIIV